MCRETPDRRLELGSAVHSPAAARRFLAEVCCQEHSSAELHAAQLLTSELVTNAVRHGAAPVSVDVACQDAGGLRVEVADGSTALPRVRRLRPGALGGRGMAMVQLLSDAWGVVPRATGKTVWFTLRPAAR